MQNTNQHDRSTHTQNNFILFGLFITCILHRVIQLKLIWPQLVAQIDRTDYVMQILPAEIWQEHFFSGLLYLQQSPPLPNITFGILTIFFDTPASLTLAVLLFQSCIAALSIALFSSLLMKFQLPRWVCIFAPAVLFFSGDILVMEYNAMGRFFYEQASMLLCLLACHCAYSFKVKASIQKAMLLGLLVALLALTRSTFSFFAIPVLIWVFLAANNQLRLKAALAFILPILVLHGGWSVKNYMVYGYWNVATSTWGGANARTGDIRRNGANSLFEWAESREPMCEQPWWDMVNQFKGPLFFFPNKQGLLNYPQPHPVISMNEMVAETRGKIVLYDTETVRHYSQCLQRIYLNYWMSNPFETIINSFRSYQIFWLPIREFAGRNPVPMAPPQEARKSLIEPHLWLTASVKELQNQQYEQVRLDLNFPPTYLQREDALVITIPSIALIMHFFNFILLHALPVVAITLWVRRKKGGNILPPATSFLILSYLYIAGLSSLVEHGENMRFRLEVEPIVWVLALISCKLLLTTLRKQES